MALSTNLTNATPSLNTHPALHNDANRAINQIAVNVRAEGATGNGSTNDTAAIQTAINAAVTAGGGVVYFPRGTYNVTTLYVTDDGTSTGGKVDGVQLAGAGRYATVLDGAVSLGRRDADSPNDNHTDGNPQTSNGVAVRHLTIDGSLEFYACQRHSLLLDVRVIPRSSPGLLARYSNTLQIIDCRFDGGSTTIDAVHFETCHDINVWGSGFNAARVGVTCRKANSGDARATNVWFRGCHFEGNNRQALLLEAVGSGGIQGCSLIGNDKQTPGTYATIDLDGGGATATDIRGFAVRDNWFSANTSGTGTGIRVNRVVGTLLGGGRITNFATGINVTATAQGVVIEPGIVWDTVTTQTSGYNPPWGRVFESSCRITTAAGTGTTYVLAPGQADPTAFNVNTASGATSVFKRIVAADLAKPGMTTRMRLAGQIAVSATTPGVDVTVGLYPVTIVANVVTPGAAIHEVALNSAGFSADSFRTVAGSSFTIPSDGTYVLGVKVSGTPSAAFAPHIELQACRV